MRAGLPLLIGVILGLVGWGISLVAPPDVAASDRSLAIGCLPWWMIISLWMLARALVVKATTKVALTNRRVILKWGVFRRHTVDIYLDKVEGMAEQQTILGSWFDYGSIAVRGTGGGNAFCPGIAKPQEFCRTVNERIQKDRSLPHSI